MDTASNKTFKLRRLFPVLLLAAALTGCGNSPSSAGPAEADRSIAELPRGAVVFERPDGVYRMDLGGRGPVLLAAKGAYPRWSHDGRRVAFVRGRDIMVVDAAGGEPVALARADEPRAVAWMPGGKEVLFSDGKKVRGVNVETRAERDVVSGYTFRELDVSHDGLQLVATIRGLGPRIRVFDLARGGSRELSAGCSASFSPDGKLITRNEDGHRKLSLVDAARGKSGGAVHAPPGATFDNQFWSNDPDWIVSQTEGKSTDLLIHHVPSDRVAQVTRLGDAGRPDLFIER